jgi:hypothetical protein
MRLSPTLSNACEIVGESDSMPKVSEINEYTKNANIIPFFKSRAITRKASRISVIFRLFSMTCKRRIEKTLKPS